MKKIIRKFTRDADALCGCAKCVAKRVSNATTDERKPVDLNEIHRSFWAKLSGKE